MRGAGISEIVGILISRLSSTFIAMIFALCFVCGTLIDEPAEAADLSKTVAGGARLRVRVEGQHTAITGTWIRNDGEAVAIRSDRAGETLMFQPSQIEQLEVSRERKDRSLTGFFVGLLAGAIVGGLLYDAESSGPDDDAVIGAAIGGGIGSQLGLFVGSQMPRDVWSAIPRESFAGRDLSAGQLCLGVTTSW